MSENQLRSSLFGLRKKAIDSLIRELKQSMTKEMTDFHLEISKREKEENRLMDELIQLEEELNVQKEANSGLEDVEKRLPSVLMWLDRKTEEELSEMKGKYEKYYEEQQAEIRKLELEIGNGSQLLDGVIKQFTKGIEHLNDLDKLNEMIDSVKEGPILPRFQMPFSEESLIAHSSAFWEGSEQYLSPDQLMKPDDAMERQPVAKAREYVDKEEAVQSIPDLIEQPVQEKEHETLEQVGQTETKLELPESEGMKREIDNIKKRYIIGKISGIDIQNAEGVMLINQNEVITEEALEKISRIGRLTDLIVHMKIPELGVSSDE